MDKPVPMECQYCKKKCYFQSYLKRHEKIHSNFPTEFECDICSQVLNQVFFKTKKGYDSHLRHVHGINTKPLKNEISSPIYWTQEDYNSFFSVYRTDSGLKTQ